jgi:transcriptional regulator with XRE-family HTH domain
MKKAGRAELRDFLKQRRALLKPEDVGLVAGGRRRVPGLRREEVAELAGISLAWYTQLETARDIRVSPRLLDRLAAVLRLSDDDKLQLFSMAIDELPTLPRATIDSFGSTGKEYAQLAQFARRSVAASTVTDLADLTTELLFDMEDSVADAYFVSANLPDKTFCFLSQRNAPKFSPIPNVSFDFSSVHDAQEVLVAGGLSAVTDVAERDHAIFAPRAKELGAGRFISKGLHAPSLDGAIGYFQASSKPFSARDSALLSLISEIVYIALVARA